MPNQWLKQEKQLKIINFNMKNILFTDHPDQGQTFIIETNATKNALLDIEDFDKDDIVDYLVQKGFFAKISDYKVSHIFDMPNSQLDIVYE